MDKTTRYSPEVRERAVRLVQEHEAEHPSQWAAICSVASKIGCSAETLRHWSGGPSGMRAVGLFRPGGARPPRELMVAFIDTHRASYGVEPICAVLPIAPSTFYEAKARAADPTRQPARASRGPDRRAWATARKQLNRERRCLRAVGTRGSRRAPREGARYPLSPVNC
jgi:hypothetical protein